MEPDLVTEGTAAVRSGASGFGDGLLQGRHRQPSVVLPYGRAISARQRKPGRILRPVAVSDRAVLIQDDGKVRLGADRRQRSGQ